MFKRHDYHRLIPKDVKGNLRWRAAVYRRAAADPEFAAAIKQACAEDPLFWINGFVWTYDPRRRPHTKLPMITYEYQDESILELVDAVHDGYDLLIEKSRDMGASWICLLVFMWFWMFRRMQSFLLLSRVEAYVDDKGNPKSLFWKLDFALEHMPSWLRPRYERTKMHLVNYDTGSVFDGESTNGDAARGDRRTAILLDEFAAVEFGHRVLSATRDATDCRIFNSTHQGTATAYYKISRSSIAKLRMHWSKHPLKARGLYTRRDSQFVFIDNEYWSKIDNPEQVAEELDAKIAARGVTIEDGKLRSPWYADQCERSAHAVEVAQELDIDCLGSSYQFFSAATIENYIGKHCCAPFHVGDLEYDQETLDPIGWRENPRGRMRLWIHLDEKGMPVGQPVVLGIDVSAGTGASNSTISAINTVSIEKVFEFANPHIRPEAFGRLGVAVAKWFGRAFMIWEQNGPGRQFGDAVIEAGYRNIFYRPRDDEAVSKVMSSVPGWAPTRDGKLALLGDYRRALELGTLINRSEASLRDCLEYVYLPNGAVEHAQAAANIDPTGARSNHGDRTIADALAWKAIKDRPHVERKSPRRCPVGSFGWRREQWLKKQRRSFA